MGPLSATARRLLLSLCAVVAALGLAGLAVSLFVYPFEKPLPYLLGLLAGGLLSAAKVVLLEKSLGKSLDMPEKDAANYTRLMFVLRYFLTMGVLVGVVLLRRYVGIIGALLGILSLQLAAYLVNFLESRAEKKAIASGEKTPQYITFSEEEDAPPAGDAPCENPEGKEKSWFRRLID